APPSAASSPTARPKAPARQVDAAGRGWLALLKVIVLSPRESFFDGDRRRSLEPSARAIRHQFDQFDPVFADGHDLAIALSHVDARTHPIGDLVRCDHEGLHAAACPDRARHLQTVERKLLERLAGTVRVRARATAAALVGERLAERI